MKTYRCKFCGYVYKSPDEPFSICPVCGRAGSPFTPYNPEMSGFRFALLRNPPHQLMVHFPVAIPGVSVAVGLLSVAGIISPADSATVIRLLAVILPFAVAAAGMAGIIDARTRILRLNTNYLRIKITTAVIFLILAVFYAFLPSGSDLSGQAFIIQSILVNTIFTVLAGILGYYGSRYICVYIRKSK